jgi:hypothetical protein
MHLTPTMIDHRPQLVSASRGYSGHSVTLYGGRIFDSAEKASMPLSQKYLDRCVREDKDDTDTFGLFRNVLLLKPKPKVIESKVRQRRKRNAESGEPSSAAKKSNPGR